MSLITQHFSTGGSDIVSDNIQKKNTLISQYFPTQTRESIIPEKEKSFFDKISEKVGPISVKRTLGNIGAGLGGVTSSILDFTKMVFQRSEGEMEQKSKVDTSGLPNPMTSFLNKSSQLSPIVENDFRLLMRKTEPNKLSPKSDIFAALSDPIKKWSAEVSPENPTFMDQLQQGVGSMAGYTLLSMVGGLGPASMGFVEAASEAGNVYEANREKGMSIGEASERADKDFFANLVINYFTNKLGIFGDEANKFKHAINSVASESAQEGLQQITSNVQTDTPIMTGVLESAAVGGILGGTVSVILPNGQSMELNQSEQSAINEEESLSKLTGKTERQSISVRDQYEGAETALASVKPDGTGSIAVVLKKDAQGKGLGSKIVSDLELKLADRGVSKVDLRSFPEAVGFWEKQGYEVSGEEKNHLVPMVKDIKQSNTEIAKTVDTNTVSTPDKTTVKDLNRPFNEENTKKIIESTKAGKREEFRLDSEEKIAKNSSGLGDAKPSDTVIVYRAGEGEIGTGNYVTTSKQRAQDVYVAERAGSTLLQKEVKISDLVRGDGFKTEFVYSPKSETKVAKKVDRNTTKEKLKNIKKSQKESSKKTKKILSLESIQEEQIKNVKNEKSAKKLLKNVRSQLEEMVVEANALAEIATAKREGINTKDVAKLKGIIAINKKFQNGDLETIRDSKAGPLLNRVIENIQEVHPEMEEREAFEFAIDLPTKADQSARTSTIVALEKKEKKLQKFIEQLRKKQEELGIKEDDALTAEWRDVIAIQEDLTKIISVPRAQLPVGQGVEKVSRLEARIAGKLKGLSVEERERLGLSTYKQMNKKNNIAMAAEYATNNQEDALKVLRGEIEAPEGILVNSIAIALRELGSVDTNLAIKVATLASTRAGQEISILSEIDPDSPSTLIESVVKTRVEALKRKTGRSPNVKIKNEVKNMSKDINTPSVRQWDTFLKEILC